MVSDLAIDDVATLRAEGLNPTDADVVRLNFLALRITNAAEIAPTDAPRVAFAGETVFHEPTLAALYFIRRAKDFARNDDALFWIVAFAYAHGRERGCLDNLYAPGEIRRAVKAWKKSVAATKREVERAVVRVSLGDDGETAEPTDIEKAKNLTAEERERRNFAALEETLGAAAASTGLTLDELLTQTPGRLGTLIFSKCAVEGHEMKPAQAKAHADYLSTLKAIRDRLVAEKEKPSDGK